MSSSSIRFIPISIPVDLTPNGRTAVLENAASPQGDVYFYNTLTGKLTLKTQVGDPGFDLATAVSAEGRVSALHGVPAQAGLWTEGGGWLDLGSLYREGCGGSGTGGAWDLSANGRVAVGLLWRACTAEAFRWTDASGAGLFTRLQVLGHSYPGSTRPPTNRATVVSDDGQIAAGFAQTELVDRSPAVWLANATGFLLPLPIGGAPDAPGEVLSINTDGSVVAGTWYPGGFYWTRATGTVTLPTLPSALPSDPVYPNAIAAGGQLIFGGVGDAFFSVPTAFVWTAAGGMRALVDVAAANGVVIPSSYTLTNVMAASTDGSVLLGVAYDESFRQISFVLRLPVSAYGL